MKRLEDFQKEMIIDRREVLSKFRRISEWSVNAVGWVLWYVLIRPAVILSVWYFFYLFFKRHMFELKGIENVEFFGIGAGVVFAIFAMLFAWNRYNFWRYGGLDRRKSRGSASTSEIAAYYNIQPDMAEKLKNEKNLNVYFDKTERMRIVMSDGTECEALYAPLNQALHRDSYIAAQKSYEVEIV